MASRSSSYDEPDSVNQSPHKWTTWEVRALICLIIKGEHRVYDDPAYFTDKLNSALNPSPSVTNKSNGSSNGETDAPMRPSRSQQDIPHRDVQAMLKRILTKKKHAVEISQRDHTYNVTRKKMAAFMRNIDFDGSPEEWEAGRREKVLADGVKKQNKKRITGRREKEERKRRKAMIRSPRAKNLLINWGIGASFWEGELVLSDKYYYYYYSLFLSTETNLIEYEQMMTMTTIDSLEDEVALNSPQLHLQPEATQVLPQIPPRSHLPILALHPTPPRMTNPLSSTITTVTSSLLLLLLD